MPATACQPNALPGAAAPARLAGSHQKQPDKGSGNVALMIRKARYKTLPPGTNGTEMVPSHRPYTLQSGAHVRTPLETKERGLSGVAVDFALPTTRLNLAGVVLARVYMARLLSHHLHLHLN